MIWLFGGSAASAKKKFGMCISLLLLVLVLLVGDCASFRPLVNRCNRNIQRISPGKGPRSFMTIQMTMDDLGSYEGVFGIFQEVNGYRTSLSTLLETKSLLLSEGGLSADTLNAIGNSGDLSDAADMAVEGVGLPNIGADILQRLVGSPLILAVPILAGILVAAVLGFGISSYSNIKDD